MGAGRGGKMVPVKSEGLGIDVRRLSFSLKFRFSPICVRSRSYVFCATHSF